MSIICSSQREFDGYLRIYSKYGGCSGCAFENDPPRCYMAKCYEDTVDFIYIEDPTREDYG